MKKQIVKLFKKNADHRDVPVEDEAYVIDTSNLNDLDNFYREVYQLARRRLKNDKDFYTKLSSDYWEAFDAAWDLTLSNIDVVTTADWRYTNGSAQPPSVSPAMDKNGVYLTLNMTNKAGFIFDVANAHGYTSGDREAFWLPAPGDVAAKRKYWEWCDKHVLNYDNLTQLDDKILA